MCIELELVTGLTAVWVAPSTEVVTSEISDGILRAILIGELFSKLSTFFSRNFSIFHIVLFFFPNI